VKGQQYLWHLWAGTFMDEAAAAQCA